MTEPTKTTRTRAPKVEFAAIDGEHDIPFVKATRTRERSDYLKELDRIVARSFDTGKHESLLIEPTQEAFDAITRHVRNSGTFLGLGIKIGQPVRRGDKGVFVFQATDRIKRPRKAKSE